MKMNRVKSFTLVELLIVVIIIGTLAALAMPLYQSMVDRAKFAEAWVNLNAIWKAEELYRMQHGEYAVGNGNNGNISFLDQLDIDNPNNDPGTMFKYVMYPNPWLHSIAPPGNDVHWMAQGNTPGSGDAAAVRIPGQDDGPEGAVMLLHFTDGHIEKWRNYPWRGKDTDWRRIQ